MTESITTNYGWTKPELQKSPTTWGKFLNDGLDSIDSIVFSNQQGLSPVGTGALWFIATPPANWLICNGQTLDIGVNPEYTALKNLIGYTYGGSGNQFVLPNLTQRFPLGAGLNAVGATGGQFSVPIAVANLPPHAHPITDVAHNHGASQPAHNHGDYGHGHSASQAPHAHGNVQQSNIGNYYTFTGNAWFGPGVTDTQQPPITIATGYANLAVAQPAITVAASGTGLSTTQNVGSGTPLNVAPPWIAIYFIIRFK